MTRQSPPGDLEPRAAIAEGVRVYRDHHGRGGELELRLGSRTDDGRFVAGVPRNVLETLERELADAGLRADRGWTELVDYFYVDAAGRTVRTRVTFDSDRMTVGTQHVRKETLEDVIVCRDDDPLEACRMTACIEHPVDPPPASCLVNHVRVKQRRRFLDVRGDDHVVFSFELSKTWFAGSRDAVEFQQHNADPVYEVECELIDAGGAYLAARADSDVAESLLMKARMLLGDDVDGRLRLLTRAG
ncbi:MAG: hypothetical protein VXX04_06030, partial [Actinomycetota bacterium]|nr:hypothetical protein [Actinomycetota bacterium]